MTNTLGGAVFDRVQETSSTQGQSDYILAGAVSNYLAFASAVPNNGLAYYLATDGLATGATWEIGIGTVTYGAPNILKRTEIVNTSAGNTTPISWPAGTRKLFLIAPAEILADGQMMRYGTATFLSNVYTITSPKPKRKFLDGMEVDFKVPAGGGNTGAATAVIDGLATKNIKKGDGTVALTGGELPAGAIARLKYDAGLDVLHLMGVTVQPPATTYLLNELSVSTNQSVHAAQGGTAYNATAAVTLTIDQTTTLTTAWWIYVNATGGKVTLTPNAADKINNNSTGASLVIPKGYCALVTTDANGNLYAPQSPGNTLFSATVASASTTDIGSPSPSIVNVSGTGTITSFGSTMLPGQSKIVIATGAWSLTYNASSMIIQGGASWNATAGDMFLVTCVTASNYQVAVFPASGLPVVSPTVVMQNYLSGCLGSSISGTNTTAAVTIAAGQAADSTNAQMLTCAGYSWAVSHGNAVNGYQGGSTLPNSSVIHFFLISGASGTGSFASTSLAPTLPSGYTLYRRIFSLLTNSSGALIPVTMNEQAGGARECELTTQTQDVNTTTLGTTKTMYTLNVPTGIKVRVMYRATMGSIAAGIILTGGDETDVAPTPNSGSTMAGFTTVPGADLEINATGGWAPQIARDGVLRTNTSGQIGARSSAASTPFNLTTRGWIDDVRS